jgi:hypothetical protein
VLAQSHDGICPMAEDAMLLGAKRKDVPPGIGTLPEVLARYGLTAQWVNLMSELQSVLNFA